MKKIKKYLSLLLVAVMVLSAVPVTVYGADGESLVCTGCGTQHVDHNFGNDICTVCGTYQPATLNSDGYYEIGNAGQFLWFGEKINADERSINGKLVDDIDLSGIKYIPITAPYRGTFDGCGHKISNMNVPSEEFNYQGTMKYGYAGLFGGLGAGAVVKNFTLTGSITCSADMKYVGGVAAYTTSVELLAIAVVVETSPSKTATTQVI